VASADCAALQELLRSEPPALGPGAPGSSAARKERDLGGGTLLPALSMPLWCLILFFNLQGFSPCLLTTGMLPVAVGGGQPAAAA
jgi:hypothetical protein